MVRNSQLGNEVAAEMYQLLGNSLCATDLPEESSGHTQVREAVYEERKELAKIAAKKATYANILHSLSKISSDLEHEGLSRTSKGVAYVRELIISEAEEVLDELGLESQEEDNIGEALDRRPDLAKELREELLQDTDIEEQEDWEEDEGPAPFLDDIGMDLGEQLSMFSGDDVVFDDEEGGAELDFELPDARREELERMIQEWDEGAEELDEAIAAVDGWLEKYAADVDGFEGAEAGDLDVDLELDLSLSDLLGEEESLDAHMADAFLTDDGWEDE